MRNSYAPIKFAALLAASLSLQTMAATAQANFPSKPVRIIVATAAGGPTDYNARLVAEVLQRIGYQVVVDNRGAAGGVLAVQAVTKSNPDGYTLLVSHASPIVIFQSLLPEKPPYDALKDLTPISHLSNVATIALVNPEVPVKTLQEFIAYAKARPGQLNYSSTGTGNMPHLTGERFKMRTGLDLVHVPYNSAPQALTAIITGEAAFGFQSPDSLEQYKAGKVRALATSAKKRLSNAPDVPTMDEAGLPGFTSGAWYGLYGPANMPKPIVDKIQADVAKGLAQPDVVERATKFGFELIASTPEQLAAHMRSEVKSWSGVIEAAKIQMK
jgi:tripartite-type tricarboxylate transporter receptor subunit TctC